MVIKTLELGGIGRLEIFPPRRWKETVTVIFPTRPRSLFAVQTLAVLADGELMSIEFPSLLLDDG